MRRPGIDGFDRLGGGEAASGFIKGKARTSGVGKAIGLASLVLGSVSANAQQSAPLPPVTVDEPAAKKRPPSATRASRTSSTANRAARRAPQPTQPAAPSTSTGGGAETAGTAYNPGVATGLSRLPTSVLNTPQSITIVPRQLMDDQRTGNVVDALKNVPGISFFGGEGGTQGDNINIHGYSARNDFYRDGIRDPGWYTRDSFSVENVEVLKGPSSFLFGRGSTGGVVNLTSKLPKFNNDFTTVEVSGYSSPGVRSVADWNRSVGNVAARIVVLGLDSDVAGRDHVKNKRVGVAPSLTYKFNEDTRVTASYIYQHDDNVPDYGIPILPGAYYGPGQPGRPAPVDKSTFYGTVNDYEKVDAHIATLKFEHDINNDWKITNDARYSYIDRRVSVRGTQVSGGLYDSPGGTAYNTTAPNGAFTGANLGDIWVKNGNYFENHTKNTLATNLTGLTGRFNTGELEHTISAGVEVNRETRDHLRTTYAQTDADGNYYDYVWVNMGSPNPYTSPGVGSAPTLTSSEGHGVGLYLGDQIKINKYFEVLGGIRYDYLKVTQDPTTSRTGPVPTVTDTVKFTSYRAGAVFHPVENSSVYYMYGTSFDPSSEFLTITDGQQNLGPVTNETHEVGVKYDTFNHRLSLSSAVFQVTQNNALEQVDTVAGEAVYGLVGKTRVKGVEFGVAGKITDKWSVFGGYTYLDSHVLASVASPTTIGKSLQNVAHNSFSLTSNYAITDAFTVGASAFYVGQRWVNTANTSVVPGYWRFDTMASYKVNEKLTLQANVWNILDTKNFESFSGFGSAQPGPGRTFILTAKYKF